MMIRNVLIDEQWKRIEPLLSGKPSDCGVTGRNNRLSLEAVLWVCRTGAPWRDLPEALGSSIFQSRNESEGRVLNLSN